MTYSNELALDKLTRLKADYDAALMSEHSAEVAFYRSLTAEQKILFDDMTHKTQQKKNARSEYYYMRDELARKLSTPKTITKKSRSFFG